MEAPADLGSAALRAAPDHVLYDRAARRLALACVVGACLVWGGSFLMAKVALRELTAPHVVLWRFVLAVPALLLLAAGRARPTRADAGAFLFGGLLGVPVLFLLQVEGVARTTATRAALLIGLIPPLSALGAALLGERLRPRTWAAVAVSSVGLVLLVGWPEASAAPGRLVGDALVVASAVVSVGYILVTRRLLVRYSALGAAAWLQLAGTAVLVPFVLARGGWPPVPVRWETWAALAGLGVGCTALANALWNVGLKHLGTARAGLFVNLEPVFGVLLGVALLGEPVGAGIVAGGGLIFVAALLAG